MYPNGELAALQRRREHLVRRSLELRAESVRAARAIERSLSWVEKAYALWHKYAPLIKYGAIPAFFVARKFVFPRVKILGSLVRWAPVLFSVIRGLRAVQQR